MLHRYGFDSDQELNSHLVPFKIASCRLRKTFQEVNHIHDPFLVGNRLCAECHRQAAGVRQSRETDEHHVFLLWDMLTITKIEEQRQLELYKLISLFCSSLYSWKWLCWGIFWCWLTEMKWSLWASLLECTDNDCVWCVDYATSLWK